MIKKGNRLASAAIEFESQDSLLAGYHLLGFTICEDVEKNEIFVLFPSNTTIDKRTGEKRTFLLLRPENRDLIQQLEDQIINVYESMVEKLAK